MLKISEFILNSVVNSSWQIGVIFLIAAFGAWLLTSGPARYRHILWIVALIACVLVPLLTATRFVPRWVSRVETTVFQNELSGVPRVYDAEPSISIGDEEFPTIDLVGVQRTKSISATPRTALFVAFGYALFILGRAIRLVRFWQRKERLRRSATTAALAPEIEIAAQRCRSLYGVNNVAVARSSKIRVPYTLGARRPLILLPDAFCAGADETKLLSVIGHEMAHVARRDFLSNLICELVRLPISFHPLTFFIKQQIDRTRELACDELVTKHVLAPKVYARSLLWAADVSQQHSSPAFMLSIFDGKILEERIMRLTRNKRGIGAGPARVMMLAALFVLCVSAMSLSLCSFDLQTRADAFVLPGQALTPSSAEQPLASNATPPRAETQLTTETAEDRAMAACKAGRRGDVDAIPSLIALLADDNKTQFIPCWNTGRWSPALQTFKHPSPGEQAALALASFGRPAFEALSQQLDSSNSTVRRNAAWAIGELTNMVPGERAGAVPQLITLLSDSDEWVRMAAARALGELHDERAVTRLVTTLSDDNWRVRELAVWALSETKDERAVTALCNVLLSDVRVEVRRGAAEALGEIRSAEAIPALKQALNDAGAGVSAKAAWAISEIEG